ncbi:hypothetical protein Hdeb2414_s0041g00737711 [Helianthus debilis subsp. tardiflorus]
MPFHLFAGVFRTGFKSGNSNTSITGRYLPVFKTLMKTVFFITYGFQNVCDMYVIYILSVTRLMYICIYTCVYINKCMVVLVLTNGFDKYIT